MRTPFDEKLDFLNRRLLQMASLVVEAIHKALKAIVEHDIVLAEDVVASDPKINRIMLEIEGESIETIALQQPVGRDLRRVITMLKIADNLERIGDHAASIAKAYRRIHETSFARPIPRELREMGSLAEAMIQGIIEAYVERDANRALEIAAQDDRLDALHKKVLSELVQRMSQESSSLDTCAQLLFIARSLERVGDYVTNICEWIAYLETGEFRELNP